MKAADKDIFLDAIEIAEAAERKVFVEAACADTEQRVRVGGLLRSHFKEGAFMEEPALSTLAGEEIGIVIGRYTLLEKLGEGGFGTVYVARQAEPIKRCVALKIIKLGMDTRQVVARFEGERQALALMDHPNIAKVFDAGATESGRPYFVMELVRGAPITQFCDNHNLSTRERLDLFIQVCNAIQHAHQKGVIHRDIKPSNVLVTMNDGAAIPRVIDFGIAKAIEGDLTEKTIYTQNHQFIGTLAYMSPEQTEMSGLRADTRSDIYGLGVLLYELLTGTTPFDAKELSSSGIDQMRRTIREKDPVRPSTRLTQLFAARAAAREASSSIESQLPPARSKIDSDLDWIVMKCLEKDRTRRYETANGLTLDIQRHLNNEPVTAAAPTVSYKVRKFIRRNRAAVAIAALIASLLVAGVATSTSLAIRAGNAERAALVLRDDQIATNRKLEEQLAATEKERQRADLQKATAEENYYTATVILAQQAADRSDHPRLDELLEQVADFPARGFEWYFWRTQEHRMLARVQGHIGAVHAGAWSPDGRRVVTAGSDATARVWDVVQRRELLALPSHSAPIQTVCWSADGKWIATGSDDHTAKIWDSQTGALVRTFSANGARIWAVALSFDAAELFAGGNDGHLRVFAVESGLMRLKLSAHSRGIRFLALSPDGSNIATASADGTAKLWESGSGKSLGVFSGHKGWVTSVAFSPSGQQLVTAADEDRFAKVWDVATRRELFSLSGHGHYVNSAVYSPDGQWIATASDDRTLRLWDARIGRELRTLTMEQSAAIPSTMIWASLNFVAFSPDSRTVLGGSEDATVLLWQPTELMAPSFVLENVPAPTFLAFSPDGRHIVCGGPGGAGAIREMSNGVVVELRGHTANIHRAAFSPDGNRVVTASADRTARIWDSASGREFARFEGHSDSVYGAIFAMEGQRVITAGADRTIRLWEASTGRELKQIATRLDSSMIGLLPKGHFVSSGIPEAGTVRPDFQIRDTQTLEVLATVLGHSAPVVAAAVSFDGKYILSGGYDNIARLWKLETRKETLLLRHRNEVQALAFSPDGQRLLTWANEEPLALWNSTTGQQLLTLPAGKVSIVAFSPDGRTLASADGNRTDFWTIASPQEVAQWDQSEAAASNRVAQARAEWAEKTRRANEARQADPGAIKDWLLLGPIPVPPITSEAEPLFKLEMLPFRGKTIRIGEMDLSWKPVQAPDTILNLKSIFDGQNQWSAAHALCVIHAEIAHHGIGLLVGTDDYGEVQLNGQRVYSSRFNRGFLQDEDIVEGLHLKAGTNILVFTVVNETSDWKGSVRLTDSAGAPLKGIRAGLDF